MSPIDTFGGGSAVIDYRGQIVGRHDYSGGSSWVAGTIDVEALRRFRANAQWDNWIKDLTTEQYQLIYEEPVYPKNLYLDRAPYTHDEYRREVIDKQIKLMHERDIWVPAGHLDLPRADAAARPPVAGLRQLPPASVAARCPPRRACPDACTGRYSAVCAAAIRWTASASPTTGRGPRAPPCCCCTGGLATGPITVRWCRRSRRRRRPSCRTCGGSASRTGTRPSRSASTPRPRRRAASSR